MIEKRKYFREKVGMVFRVSLRENNQYAYGQIATDVENIFFDHVDTEGQWTPVEQILQKPVIFYVTVDQYVLKEGIWEVLGVWPVDPQNTIFPDPFTYDEDTNKYYIFKNGVGEIQATKEEIEGRECLASCGHGIVEQRLRDHFAKRPNYDWEYDRSDDRRSFSTRKEFYKQYGYDFHWEDEG